jgi:hypothetical protein
VTLVCVVDIALAVVLMGYTAPPPVHGPRPAVGVVDHGRELVIEYGPLTLAEGVAHIEPPPTQFEIPVDGWMRGYVVELLDRAGRRLPQRFLHHVNFISREKRDLFSPVMLRLGAAGPETRQITLPRLLGVRGERGDTVIMTVMLRNPTAVRYDDVWLRVRVAFVRSTSRLGALAVYPLSVAIGPKEQPNTFDLPPGRSEHYWEGSPAVPARILGLGGHLHRYGVALRLEDRTSRTVIWEIRPKSDSSGDVREMPISLFLWTLGKPIRPDHTYRLTAVYENPEGRTIQAGGMGVMGGVVILPRGRRWPTVDRRHLEYVADVEDVLGPRVDGRRREGVRHARHGRETSAPRIRPADSRSSTVDARR